MCRRISDLKGTRFDFPQLSTMKSMKTLILRNCMIHGNIPEYFGELQKTKKPVSLLTLLSDNFWLACLLIRRLLAIVHSLK
ncbi:hypothetical protein IFM89_037073, partial [Coptis chinensis]